MRKSRAPENYAKRIKKITDKSREWRNKIRRYKREKWRLTGRLFSNRGYKEYNSFFAQELGKSVVDSLADLGKKKLEIIDDGAGFGKFLAELKEELRKKKIASRTTALTLESNRQLKRRKKRGQIDEVVVGPAEHFVPKKPVDAIFSFQGSISYTTPSVRKDHLLKFAHSLKKGGLMMVSFQFIGDYEKKSDEAIVGGFSKNPKPGRKLDWVTEMLGIKRAFGKQGFDAKFFPSYLSNLMGYPNWMLIVKRVK